MTPSYLSSMVPVTTIEVDTPPRTRAGKVLEAIAPYLVAPIATGVLFVLAVAAVAHPIPAVVSCIVLAALIGPSIDIWRRQHRKARRNEALEGGGPAK